MPIQVYVCDKCDHKFEFLRLKQDEKAECPECGAPQEFLQIDMESFKNDFQLKGRHWAKDRYGR